MDAIRIGNFTSSENYRLVGTQKVLNTYVKEKNRERRLGIELSLDSGTFNLAWGRAMESYVFQKHIPMTYTIHSDKTIMHKDGIFCGTPDFTNSDTVSDLKCPATRTSFCDMVDFIEAQSLTMFKDAKPEYYWQLVSNSILTGKPYGELIVWMPYHKEMPDIMQHIENIDDYQLQKDIQWIIHNDTKRIPHIPDNSKYKSINKFRFLVPDEDKKLLEESAIKSFKLLVA